MPIKCSTKIVSHVEDYKRYIKSVHLEAVNASKIDSRLEDIKNIVLDRTEEYIEQNRRRPSADNTKLKIIDVLRETSFVEKTDDYTYRLCIGNENVLDQKVPYWRVVNYGGVPWGDSSFLGTFEDGAPVTGGGGYPWFEGGTVGKSGGNYLMTPKKAIPPMHYLNYMAQEFKKEVLSFSVGVQKR